MILANKYKIKEQIGEGCFGKIYKGENIRTAETVAIKMESHLSESRLLYNESKILQYLSKTPFVPEMKWFHVDIDKDYMVMTLLGESIMDVIKRTRIFPMSWIQNVAKQTTKILQNIHEKEILHRDIKPENFLFGVGENKKNLYLIDFGMAKCYRPQGEKRINKLIGTKNYASVSVQMLWEPSRRDDLESLVYVLIFLYYGYLEWMNDIEDATILEKKKNLRFQPGLPVPFKKMIEYVQDLPFEEIPKYDYFLSFLESPLF
jgi:serine/threonine protein kinase